MELWFVLINQEEVGPLELESLLKGVETGRVIASTPVRSASSATWEEAAKVAPLARFFLADTPPADKTRLLAGAPGQSAPRIAAVDPLASSGSFETSGALAGLVGQELAGFRLTRLLGEGGMAVVFRGENTLDAAITRAIKVVRPELSSNPEFVKRFTEEARTLERLQHPNVVRFYGLRRERGLLVMELELLSGDSLVAYMKRAPRGLPIPEAVRLMGEAADGVGAAHAMGVVHRDLKPENLFLTSAGPLKVLDFGIARAIDDADRAGKLTQVGMTLGTPAYMAPEVCNGATPSETTDVYALGLTLYEVLTGSHPLIPEGGPRLSSAQMMFAHVNKVIPPIQSVRADVPPLLADIVARAVAKDPRERFADAAALSAALRTARNTGSGATVDAAVPGTRFDIPHIGGAGATPQHAGSSDLGQQTSFVLPSIGAVTPGGMQSLGQRGSNPGMLGADGGAQTGFGIPAIERMRTTGGAEILEPQKKSGGGKGVAMLAVVGVIGVGSAMLYFLSQAKGMHGEHASAEAKAAPSAAASGSAGPVGSEPPGLAQNEDNHWIRVNPPNGNVTLGVPDNTPPVVRGIRAARRLTAPSAPYEMQQHEVTWGEITPWLAKNPSVKVTEPPGLPADAAARKLLPVTGIPWEGAHQYCKSVGGSLPHEDEWEYAARGARLRPFPWGSDPLDLERTNVFAGPAGKLKPVMTNDQDQTPEPDAVAIFDLMGNAREWTADLYREDKPPKNPGDESWVQDGNMSWRTVRGLPLEEKVTKPLGSYLAAYRTEMCGSGSCPKGTEQRRQYVGFRCVRHGVAGADWQPAGSTGALDPAPPTNAAGASSPAPSKATNRGERPPLKVAQTPVPHAAPAAGICHRDCPAGSRDANGCCVQTPY